MRTLGISRDSPWSHRAWAEALDLDVPLLSDWSGEALRALGATATFRGLADAPRRSAFLVGGDGIIRRTWWYEPAEVPDFDALLRAARSLS